ncbi:YrhB domain-containing protein [Streptomyces sp. NPDC001970]
MLIRLTQIMRGWANYSIPGQRDPQPMAACEPRPTAETVESPFARVIEQDAAVRIVEEELERDYQRELSAGLDPMRMAVAHVEQHELVWIVSWTSEEYLRTRNPDFMLAGNGPYLVDRLDGSLHQIGVISAVTDAWEADYRVRIRGQVIRTVVNDLHDEVRAVAADRGRIHAMHTLRQRVPVLSHAQVIEYVTALKAVNAPAHLVEVATAELVPPVDPVLSVRTIRRAGHRRAHPDLGGGPSDVLAGRDAVEPDPLHR